MQPTEEKGHNRIERRIKFNEDPLGEKKKKKRRRENQSNQTDLRIKIHKFLIYHKKLSTR